MRNTMTILLAAVISAGCCVAEEPGTWLDGGTVAVTRTNGYLLPIGNGKFIAVGDGGGKVQCDVYDSATNTWTQTGSLQGANRSAFAAAALADGRVIVAGGVNNVGGGFILQSEIYSPTTGSWTLGPNINNGRFFCTAVALADGRVLLIGGNGTSGYEYSCEIYDPSSNLWTSTAGNLINRKNGPPACVRLANGNVLAIDRHETLNVNTAEVFNPVSSQWTSAGNLNIQRQADFMTLTVLPSGKVLAAGGFGNNSPSGPLPHAELYDTVQNTWTPTAQMSIGRTGHDAVLLANGKVLVIGGNSGGDVSSCELYDETTGTWSPAQALPRPSVYGSVVLLSDNKALYSGGADNAALRYSTNDPPAITVDASPRIIAPGESVAFSSTAGDLNGDATTVLWDFKDGTTSPEANPVHTFAAAGIYEVSATVSDPSNFTAAASVVITVVGGRPTARFVTSDIVGFAGQPFTFDASLSTDPQNGIVSYAWNFGDGSPAGAGQVISKIFGAEGTYTVRLDVADNDGLVGTAQREIVILPADQLGKFNSAIAFKAKFDRNKADADSLTLDAVVNVGADTPVTGGAAVAFEIVGQRFEGTLNAKLQDYSNKNEKWLVKAGTKKQGPGEVVLKLTLKKANLGLGFNQAGVLPKTDPKDPVEVTLPVKLEIAGRIFEIDLDAAFKFNKDGKKASGEGEN